MEFYERVSGARMHAAYFRPGGVYRDLPDAMPQYKASKVRNARGVAELDHQLRARVACARAQKARASVHSCARAWSCASVRARVRCLRMQVDQ